MNIRAIVIAAALMAGVSFTAQAQIQIVRSVLGSGMTPAAQGAFIMDGTLGQPVIGQTLNSNVFIDQGFWYTLPVKSGVKELNPQQDGFALEQNYPNPFNPSTTIKYEVGERTKVTIRVMNLLGEEVHAPLVDQMQDPGTYQIDFTDADNLPSGTYIYRMDAGNFSASKRMVLLK